MTTLRIPILAAVLAVVALAGCGEDSGGDAAEATATASPAAAQAVQSTEGYLISATEQAVVLRTREGKETFSIKPEDLESVGVPHLASHAGLTDLGFRFYYEQEGDTRYLKGSEEIPPPF